jgi:hypothetical protein
MEAMTGTLTDRERDQRDIEDRRWALTLWPLILDCSDCTESEARFEALRRINLVRELMHKLPPLEGPL